MAPTVLSVFVVDPLRIGGVEMYCRELSLQLSSRGWNSALCFLAEPRGKVKEFLALPNVSTEAIPGLGGRNRQTLAAFSRVLSKHRPQIVHLHFIEPLSLYPWLACLGGVRSVFFTDHISRGEGRTTRRANRLKRAIGRAITWPLTKWIAVSDFNRRQFEATGLVEAGKIVRLYNGVDLSRSPGNLGSFRSRHGIPEDCPVVLQVSWIIREKGVDDLLECARIVLATGAKAHFVVVGEGSGRPGFMRAASEMGIADSVTWTGMVEDPLVEGVYDMADIVCQLSRWQEAFGWTNAEAMASRKPVVATAVGGIPEIVEDGVSGFLVPVRQPAEAADRVLRLLGDPDLRESMGLRARQIVEQKFDLRANVGELIGLYGI